MSARGRFEHHGRAMLRALLWKEWRLQRGVAGVGVGSTIVVPVLLAAWVLGDTGPGDLWAAAETAALVNATIVWPLLAAIVGAATGGDELTSGTLRFLMSRPVSRERVWLTKSLTGASVLLVVVSFSFVVSSLFNSLAGGSALRFPFSVGPAGSVAFPDSLLGVYSVGAVALAYVTSLFFAAFVARAIESAMLGLAATVGLCGMTAVIQRALAYQPTDLGGGEPFALAALGSAAAIVLLAGLLLYRRRDEATPERSRRIAFSVGAGALLAIAGSTAVTAALTTRIDPRHALTYVVALVPGADTAVVEALREDWVGPQYFVLGTDGAFRPLTPRMSWGGELSPDGRWFAYATGMGSAGLRGDGCRIRMVGVDDGADRELARFPLIPGSFGGCRTRNIGLSGMRFSPDASRLALMVDGSLFVIDTREGGSARRVAATGVTHDGSGSMSYAEVRARAALRVVGWSSDGGNVVTRGLDFIATIRADSGTVTHRIDFREGDTVRVSRGGGALIPVVQGRTVGQAEAGDRVSERLLLFDADSGETTEVVSAPPDTWLGVWAGIDEVFYLLGPDEQHGRYRVLHRFVPATGVSERVARFSGSAFLFPSPDEDVFLVMSWDPSTSLETRTWRVAVFREGRQQRLELPPGWMIDSWLGADHLVLQRDVGTAAGGKRGYELAIADFEGNLEPLVRSEY